jgi:hypothetical protein
MAALADALQISQSAFGSLGALGAFVMSPRRERPLAEDVVLGFATGAIVGCLTPLLEALLGGVHLA